MAGVTSSPEGGEEGRRDRTDQVGLANIEVRSGDSDEWLCEGESDGDGEGSGLWGLLVSLPVEGCDNSGPVAAGRSPCCCFNEPVGCCDIHRRHIHAVGVVGVAAWA